MYICLEKRLQENMYKFKWFSLGNEIMVVYSFMNLVCNWVGITVIIRKSIKNSLTIIRKIM